jgi:NAD(P)-dependent dehydrogenase (short-subunit alcohol dehydrogenase family)
VKAQNYLLRTALPTFNANLEGGSLIMTSSIAGMAVSGSSLPYCVTKAAQLQLMRVFAASQGPKVRVNAVCPGLLLTEWVSLGSFFGFIIVVVVVVGWWAVGGEQERNGGWV